MSRLRRRPCLSLLFFLSSSSCLAQLSPSREAEGDGTNLRRVGLEAFPLARCNDGSPAAYYHDESLRFADSRVMIYLPHDPSTSTSGSASCSTARECARKCEETPRGCTAPDDDVLRAGQGVWSADARNNPFARHFKILLPSCSSDEFSGTRTVGGLVFHGRHIFTAMLRDVVAKFGVDRAEEVVLIGSGSGSRGAARNCDFLAESLATVNPSAKVRCVLDGADLAPYWVRSPACHEQEAYAARDEDEKVLWGREDDESCVKDNKDSMNSSMLAATCGTFARSWRHISTPVFVVANQFDADHFARFTCGVSKRDDDFSEYEVGWRQGVLTLAEAVSVAKPGDGWFVPNCDRASSLLDARHSRERKAVRVGVFGDDDGREVNVLQALNNWLRSRPGSQAIDPFGIPNPSCSQARSEPLDLRPDALLPEIGERDGALRHDGPGFAGGRRDFDPFFGRGRFHPPADLLPYDNAFAGPSFTSGGGHAVDGGPIFDYDDLSLGYDFDVATADSGVALGGGHVPVVRHHHRRPRPRVVRPAVVSAVGPVRPLPRGTTNRLHSPARRARLWRKLHYLEYLRRVYARHYREYHDEYYSTGHPVAPAVAPVVASAARTTTVVEHRPAVPAYAGKGPAYFARIQMEEEDGGEFPDSQVEEIDKAERLTKE